MADQPQQVSPPRFRLLDRGDVIQAGDQPLLDDCETWGTLVGWEIGLAYNPVVLVPTRRPLDKDTPNG